MTSTGTLLLLTKASSSVQPTAPIPLVDWDKMQIVESQDEEGRIELMSEDPLIEFLC